LIRKQKSHLGAHHLLVGTGPSGPLLASNGPTATLKHKLVQVLSPHEFHHLSTQLRLLLSERLDLGLEATNLIVNPNPRTKSLTYLIGH
jgi:hypothetical protein